MAISDKQKAINVKSLNTTLRKLKAASDKKDNGSVIVGYTANYALAVHENKKQQKRREERDGVGQWKYLEQPARTMRKELAKIVKIATPKVGLIKALLLAGLRLQRESQKLVPVDTGNLKGSAFTAIDKGGSVQITQGPTNVR